MWGRELIGKGKLPVLLLTGAPAVVSIARGCLLCIGRVLTMLNPCPVFLPGAAKSHGEGAPIRDLGGSVVLLGTVRPSLRT